MSTMTPTRTRAVRLDAHDADLLHLRVLKPGTFNGNVKITARDLGDLAARFAELRPVFTPPLRVDHSYSVDSVVGWLETVSMGTGPDPSAGGAEVPWLTATARLAGTADARKRLRDDVEGGRLVNISAELQPYETNAGKKYPRILSGAALVDIPAVEGARVVLARQRPATGSLAALLPLSLTPAAFGARWAALSHEQRRSEEGQTAYELWRLNHQRRTSR
ncbi:hypothetical protein [Georgenia daeguensis]|uniref:Uncharacterized protein n=1 Tax=Georgenia daeguensis TaxID=908355 RepID=A0ABP8EQK9_9MICO